MAYSYEDALTLSSLEKAQQCCEDDKSPNQPMVRMTLELFHRRKAMLIWYFSGRLNNAALKKLAEDFKCSEKALIDDWVDRKRWEPFIWESQKANDDGKDLLNQLQLAREEALYLMKTCGHALARVGAIGRYVDTIKTEIELKQSLGLLPKQTQPAVLIQQNVTNTTTNTEQTLTILAEYDAIIRSRRGTPTENIRENNP